jgi:hypothetical protein
MFFQISGISSFFMFWNTDYAHSLDILDLSEIGTFKIIPVYPTLFLNTNELYYQIGQGRPSGLLNANNILSIFAVVGVALNFITIKSTKFRYSDFVVLCIVVLTMSLMAFSATLLLYLFSLFFFDRIHKIKSIKLFFILLILSGIYYLLFPGLFEINFGEAKFIMSFLQRGLDLANSLGILQLNDIYSDQIKFLGHDYNEESTYSQFSKILKSKYVFLFLIGFIISMTIYINRIIYFKIKKGSVTFNYIIFLFCCLFTQFAVAYLEAPSFQFILGIAFYPLMNKFWEKSNTILANN